jgi:hypothetical protein
MILASRSARRVWLATSGASPWYSLVQLGAERDPLDDPLGVPAERAHVSERLLVFEPVGRDGALGAGPNVRDVDSAGGFERGDVVRLLGRSASSRVGGPRRARSADSQRPLAVASTRSLMNQRERRRSCGGCRRVRDGRGRAVGPCSLVLSGVAVGSRVASSTRAAADASRSARSRSSTVMSSRS